MKTNKQKILEFIKEKTNEKEDISFTAQELSEIFEISRANISTALNQLCLENELEKENGRPVKYHILQKKTHEEDCFKNFIGANGSMKNQIKLAKACILYPEKEVRALISGEPGTEGTLFAKKMYEFAISQKLLSEDTPFIEVNLENYKTKESAYNCFKDIQDKYHDLMRNSGGFILITHYEKLNDESRKGLVLARTLEQNAKVITVLSQEITSFDSDTRNDFAFRINLPSLEERGFEERLELIEAFFKKESEKVKKEIVINSELLRCFLLYKCEGNVKQLQEDIRIGCANAFVRNAGKETDTLNVYLSDCNPYVRRGFLQYKDNREVIEKLIPENYTYSFTGEISSKKQETTRQKKQSIYDVIDEKVKELKSRSIPEEDIMTIVSADIESDISNYMSLNDTQYDRKALEKIIDPVIIELVDSSLKEASSLFSRVYPSTIFQAMCFQIQELIQQKSVKKRISNEKITEVVEKYPEEYAFAARVTSKINKEFNIPINIDDTVLLTIYFSNRRLHESNHDKPAVLLVMHGKVASAIEKTIEGLYKTDNLYSYDLLLDQSIDEAYEHIKSLCLKIGNSKGILVLYDMGSIKKIMEMIASETGLMMRLVELPMTLFALDAIIKLDGEEKLDDVYKSILNNGFGSFAKLKEEYERYDHVNKKVIVTLCASGSGSAIQMKQYIEKNMNLDGIQVIALAASDRKVMLDNINSYRKNGEILCVVGTYDPSLYDIPFVSVAKLFNTPIEKLDLLLTVDPIQEEQLVEYQELYDYLSKQLEYININKLKNTIHKTIKRMMKKTRILASDEEMGLFLHLACMINRIKSDTEMPINIHRDVLLSKNKRMYNDIKDILVDLEEDGDVIISDDEIATIIEILK